MLCEMTHNNVKLGILKLTSGILEEIREGKKSDLGLIDKVCVFLKKVIEVV